MPRYFFDVNDHRRDLDKTGTHCVDDVAAARQGVHFASEYLRDNRERLLHDRRMQIAVVSDDERNILRVTVELDLATGASIG